MILSKRPTATAAGDAHQPIQNRRPITNGPQSFFLQIPVTLDPIRLWMTLIYPTSFHFGIKKDENQSNGIVFHEASQLRGGGEQGDGQGDNYECALSRGV